MESHTINDEATLDRFWRVEVDYDRNVERALCPVDEIREYFWGVREKIEKHGLRRILSTRFLKEAYVMHSQGWDLEQIKTPYYVGWSKDEMSKVA